MKNIHKIDSEIYVTFNEEIKVGDYRLNNQRDYFKKADKEGLDYYNKRNDVFKKIILTTDLDLIKDGIQAIDDEFLQWFVKNPSCEEVEIVIDRVFKLDEFNQREFYNKYKIIIPSSEIWKDIPEFEGYYQASNLGNIRSLNYGKIRELKLRLVGYYGNQYLAVNLSKDSEVKSIKVHKLVALCFLNHNSKGYDGLVIDHIDSNKLNNRLDNLKLVTPRFNASKDKQGSSSKFTGVSWHKKSKKWQCQIYDNGKLNHLGLFNTEIEASETYNNYLENMTKEEPKQETLNLDKLESKLDNALAKETKPYLVLVDIKAEQNNTTDLNAYANGVEEGVKWQQERSYSDMQEYAEFCIKCDRLGLPCIIAKDWFEQFKKEIK